MERFIRGHQGEHARRKKEKLSLRIVKLIKRIDVCHELLDSELLGFSLEATALVLQFAPIGLEL